MERTGIADLPLHPGRAPKWLFERMVKLSRAICEVLLYEYGEDELFRRLSDPFWFQAFSCVLGFDWHSSGCTTVTCGALKEAVDPEMHGFAVVGGKGKTSLRTLDEIEEIANIFSLSTDKVERLKYSSKMAAKVDNAALQDGHQLYHHVMFFSEEGKWAVIQQGMDINSKYARRYHWLSDNIKNFVTEPHNAIVGIVRYERVLDMTSKKSGEAQKVSLDLVRDSVSSLKRDWAELIRPSYQKSLDEWLDEENKKPLKPIDFLRMPRDINWSAIKKAYEFQPINYEEFLSIKGIGPSTVRALALISDLIYGAKPSWKDPVKYSFAVGGKDGVPFPVDRKAMDESVDVLKKCIEDAKIGNREKLKNLERLQSFIETTIEPIIK
ncbi:MAG TPA: DUF763 domain-containing protein [Thermoplasmatales archaeon]|nr:DUF763 domain-containing protein [Thermoplasmatales archaeon]HEX08401.1 DUF763 domain-containing protein [Thermoplasmatales archaeon]